MTFSLRKNLGVDGNIQLISYTQKNYVAHVCGVQECTVRRWRSTGNYPEYAKRLIAIEAGYFPWESFDGWKVAHGRLYSPHLKDGFSTSDIESLHYLRLRCALLEKRNSAPAQYYLI